ncbi:MAG: Uncharacterized protein Athens071426_670, partial [Parcubacteria group bacterium Athens0714_26]
MARIFYGRKLKKIAINLRSKGLSYKEISLKLGIAKSTSRLWVKDVVVKAEYRDRLFKKGIEALIHGPNSSHERREKELKAIFQSARKEMDFPVRDEVLKLLGAMVYWAEGSKTKNFSITNSDPLLIKFMIK